MSCPGRPPGAGGSVVGSSPPEPFGLGRSRIATGRFNRTRIGCRNFWFAYKAGSTKVSKTNTKSLVCAGIDIGKAKLDCAIAERGAELCCDNSQDGRGQLIAFLKGHGVRRVGLEASGG